MRIAISFWTFFNISSDKTDPFCALFCNRFYSETEEIYSGQTPVLSPSYLILYIFLNVSILFQRKMWQNKLKDAHPDVGDILQ